MGKWIRHSFCVRCDSFGKIEADKPNHLLHFAVCATLIFAGPDTAVLAGLAWAVVWIFLAFAKSPDWRCSRCGKKPADPGTT